MSAALSSFVAGTTPLLINVPHAGTYVPPELRQGMTAVAQTVPDTDWHVHLLYQFALEVDAGLMTATHSRYVVDLNRDPRRRRAVSGCRQHRAVPDPQLRSGRHLPAGRSTRCLRQIGARPTGLLTIAALAAALATIKARHGYAVLLDAHSIRSRVPRFFTGRLPDLNLGTADGTSCAPGLQAVAMRELESAQGFSAVLNGRFKGGYITRHYGKPGQGTAGPTARNGASPAIWTRRAALCLGSGAGAAADGGVE